LFGNLPYLFENLPENLEKEKLMKL
jgi:hypothetical protein